MAPGQGAVLEGALLVLLECWGVPAAVPVSDYQIGQWNILAFALG